MEAAEGGITFIVAITEGVPAHDEAWFFNKLQRDFPRRASCSARTVLASSAQESATSESPLVTSPNLVAPSAS